MMEKSLSPRKARQLHRDAGRRHAGLPANWEKHYHGDEKHLAQCRKYSYSDRARYYIGQPEVVAAMNKLFDNLREYPIPMNMLHQYMPISYAKIREGKLKLNPRAGHGRHRAVHAGPREALSDFLNDPNPPLSNKETMSHETVPVYHQR